MQDSWDRGHENLKFVEKGEQEAMNSTDRPKNKENFVFNICNKILKTAQANGKDIDLSVSLSSPYCEDKKEQNTFRLLINQLMLNTENVRQIGDCLDKVYAFGQGVLHIKPELEDERTLNQVLTIKNVEDVTTTFFDYQALTPTFHDGNFCGRMYRIPRKRLAKRYKVLAGYDLKNDVEVIDFWFKDQKKVNFIPLANGEYIREDLYNSAKDVRINEPSKKGFKTTISYVRVVRDVEIFLEKKLNMDYTMLPLVFNYGGTVWTGKHYETFPLCWHLRSSQTLINYTGSIIGDILKSTTADRWLLGAEHVASGAAKQAANEINTREGGLIFTGDLAKIRHEPSQQMPPALGQFFLELQNTLQSIAGAYFDDNADRLKEMSGVALDKMFNRADLVQNPVLVAHLNTINIVGKVLQAMIPIYYHENRVLAVKSEDGALTKVEINKPVEQYNGMILVENNIRDLSNKYEYQVRVSPSLRLQKQNLQTELTTLYKVYPPAVNQTIDLYVKSLDVQQADVLSRRLGATIPRALIQYGNGEINFQEYQQDVQQQQMQLQAQQQQMMLTSPQSQYLQARAKSEMSRAETSEYEAQTARLKEINAAHSDKFKTLADLHKNAADNQTMTDQQRLEWVKTMLQHLNAELQNQRG